jgi:hypothetical protein
MNATHFMRLQSGSAVVATASGEAGGYRYEPGAIAVVTVQSDPEIGKRFYVEFTSAVRLDFTLFTWQKWEVLMRCGACSRAYPGNLLQMCETCERPEFCQSCLQTHDCVIPKSGIGRHPRKQLVINNLKGAKVLCR